MTLRWKMSWRSHESTAKAAGGAPRTGAGLLLALAAPLAITALKLALPAQLGHSAPFLLYFAAVWIGAWTGGLLGGLAATALSALLGSYFFSLPSGALSLERWQSWLEPAIFVLEGLTITWLTARLRAARARAATRAAEAQLLRAQLHSVLAGIDDGITIQDANGKLLHANERAAALLGQPSAAALLGAPLPDVMARFELRAEDGSRFTLIDLPGRKALQGLPAPEQLARLRVLASGEERWCALRAAPVQLRGGAIQAAVHVLRDVTELRQRELALRESQARLESALRCSGDAVIATDAQGAVTYMSALAERLCGWSAAEAAGKPLAEVFASVDEITRVPLESPRERALRAGEGEDLGDARHGVLLDRRGGETSIEERTAPVLRAQGEVSGLVVLFRDAAPRRQEQRELADARAQAELAERAKDAFLATLGHELRGPLAPIATALQAIKARERKAIAKPLDTIERQVRHISAMVDDLLDVSRVTGGKVQLVRERSALGAVVAKAAELAAPLLAEREHELVVSVPEELRLDCDVARLAQAVGNLLANAAKYTPRRGRIEVTASASEDELMLRVRDDGVGMEPELLPRVFDLFVQGSQALDREKGGLGLGLSLVRSLIEAHGGQISAHSEGTGKGSEFRVYLPRVGAPTLEAVLEAERDEAPEEHTALEQRARLLVVDDNADALQLLSQALRRLGHEVHVAEDAVGALAMAAMFEADVALLDVGLPVIDGYQLASHLRSIPGWQDVKLVALSGYGHDSDEHRAQAAGFDEHLHKPISLEALSSVLTRLTMPPPPPPASA